jgi:raffinose/stachyose/melibiose transport system substrate-binding protein
MVNHNASTGRRRIGLKRLGVTGVTVIAVAALAACSAPGSKSTTSQPSSVSTDVSSKPVTLTMYDGAGGTAYDNKLIAAFQKKYPNITVKLRTEPDATFSTTEPRVIASDGAPDLIKASTGAMITQVKDGVLTNLDKYATAYGWDKLPAAQLAGNRVSNGVRGQGSLYAFGAPAGPMTGVFYNKKLAAQIGLTQPPADLAEFEALMAKAKAAGKTPVVVANKIGLLGHVWNLLLGDYMGADKLNQIGYHTAGASVDSPEALQATETLDKWVKAGYFNSDQNALDQDPSYGQFMNGSAAFTVQGSWVLTPLANMMKQGNLGFFPFPPAQAGGTYTAMSSPNLTFSIPAKSRNHDAAAAFLNWTQTPEAAAAAYETGYSAKSPDATTVISLDGTVQTQLSNGYAKVVADNGITDWVANATPSIYSAALTPGLQELASGKVTAQSFLSAVQSSYKDGLSK